MIDRTARRLTLAVLAALALGGAAASAAAETAPDLSGAWTVTAHMAEGSVTAPLQLVAGPTGLSGMSGALDNLGYCPLAWRGAVHGDGLQLRAQCRNFEVGTLDLKLKDGVLSGRGLLFSTPVEITARRPEAPSARPPKRFDFNPTQFHPITSAAPDPVLRIAPGDVVHTRTIDSYGLDEHGRPASMPGNPGTGPFYVEGAQPGDTVAIHFRSIRTNRDTARMNTQIDAAALMPGHVQAPGRVSDVTWRLDAASGTASLQTPSPKLKDFRTPMSPMLGVVTVALAGGMATPNRDLGEWGGNLDDPEIRAGNTLYLPVYQPGALIFMGDGHARQSHGEIAGQGLETSMDVEFDVALIKNRAMPQPWAESPDYVMVSGIGGDLTEALRRATSGLSAWLKATYGLDDSEVAAVLGSSVEYEVAEVVSARSHVLAKIRKDLLAPIPKAAP